MENNIKGLRKTSVGLAMESNKVLAVGRIKNKNEMLREQAAVVEPVVVEDVQTIDTSMFDKLSANKAAYNKHLEDLAYDRWLDEQFDQEDKEKKLSYKISRLFRMMARDLQGKTLR